jgi:hypothetical protein
LIKYLENENLLKTDLTVKAPAHNVDKDVKLFQKKYDEIKKIMNEQDRLFLENDLDKILNQIPLLIEF